MDQSKCRNGIQHQYFNNDSVVILELVSATAKAPERATTGSSGWDVFANIHNREITYYDTRNIKHVMMANVLNLVPFYRYLIPLGFKTSFSANYELQVRPKSGLALKQGIKVVNSPGTVDSDFADELMVIIENTSEDIIQINEGDKIAQIVFTKVETPLFVKGIVVQTTNRTGGFGSTGV